MREWVKRSKSRCCTGATCGGTHISSVKLLKQSGSSRFPSRQVAARHFTPGPDQWGRSWAYSNISSNGNFEDVRQPWRAAGIYRRACFIIAARLAAERRRACCVRQLAEQRFEFACYHASAENLNAAEGTAGLIGGVVEELVASLDHLILRIAFKSPSPLPSHPPTYTGTGGVSHRSLAACGNFLDTQYAYEYRRH